jgi:hypothetical protein
VTGLTRYLILISTIVNLAMGEHWDEAMQLAVDMDF